MKGYQLTFYTEQNRQRGVDSLAQWLLNLAKEHGAAGGTLFSAGEGFGRDGHFHSAHFFELADQPVAIVVAVDEATCESVLGAIRDEQVDVFYVKTPIEYGRTGHSA